MRPDPQMMISLGVETWNMHHGFSRDGSAAAWQALVARERTDVALLQESAPPSPALEGYEAPLFTPDTTVSNRVWGTAIWTRHHRLRPLDIEATVAGTITAAELDADGPPITLISVYGKPEHLLGTEYSITTLHHVLSDLTGLLEDRRRRGRIVLGGDFNANPAWDKRQRNRSHRLLFDRLENFGLRSVLPYDPPAHATFRKNIAIRQIDYLFVSSEISVTEARVLDDPEPRDLSDHWPVAAALEIDD